jgi:hypothetical protein
MHGLETISYIRKSPANNDAHGIIQIGMLYFVFNADTLSTLF